MNREERIKLTTQLLINFGWGEDSAKSTAIQSADNGEPVLETYSFHALAESLLAPIHDSSWITERDSEDDGDELISRLLESGADSGDLAKFARLMQRQFLSNLACILDGSGIYPSPDVAFEEFRVVAVDDDSNPIATLEDLHEELSFQDWETENEISERYANSPDTDG
ncbi:hypothetical protein [Rosistilla oblonga]|uniref:Uncharacterized protein n=1 Tax=Rosistilla oblonga TaxID=2527990 RepID=A0A518IPY6_9BACT|nr:hypothetical protein [Rosistilla oblonga]QDV55159.1 hypothetical protein Mal33_11280 [Rosistilla oblonga]